MAWQLHIDCQSLNYKEVPMVSPSGPKPVTPPVSTTPTPKTEEVTEPKIVVPKGIDFSRNASDLGLKLYSIFERFAHEFDINWLEAETDVEIRDANGSTHWTTERDLKDAVCRYLLTSEKLPDAKGKKLENMDEKDVGLLWQRFAKQITLENLIDKYQTLFYLASDETHVREYAEKLVNDDLQIIEDIEKLKKTPSKEYQETLKRVSGVLEKTEKCIADLMRIETLGATILEREALLKKRDDGKSNKEESEKLQKIESEFNPEQALKEIKSIKSKYPREIELMRSLRYQAQNVGKEIHELLFSKKEVSYPDLFKKAKGDSLTPPTSPLATPASSSSLRVSSGSDSGEEDARKSH